ncbi:MAG TPA: LppX_LprAFG lipoprotein [Pilimelia sp.]|nr:LppX_LprAFG lipoprotein [Pilimelia sp.]
MRRPIAPGAAGRWTAALAALALAVAALTACTDSGDKPPPAAGDLPPGDTLVKDAAAAMRAVRTAEFDITSEGTVDRLGIRGAQGVITSEGDARGTARIDQAGTLVELSFVAVDDTLYLKGATGGWQQVPLAAASSVYDPSLILNPDRGVANVLATATDATTEARETVDGTPAYRVKANLKAQALAAIAPGVSEDVTGTLWIGTDRKVLHRASFVVPGAGGGGTVTVTLRKFDAPVTIRAP